MMKPLYYIVILFALYCQGCNKLEVTPLLFKVSAHQTTIQAGEAVHFSVDGNAEMITFFSGEAGSSYTEPPGADLGVSIKSLIDAELTAFSHVYNIPGAYEAVFVATNGNVAGTTRDIRRIRIIVE